MNNIRTILLSHFYDLPIKWQVGFDLMAIIVGLMALVLLYIISKNRKK